MRTFLKTWMYALGSYSDEKTKRYDKSMLVIRSLWVMLHIVTCLFIIVGIITVVFIIIIIIIGNGRLLELW